MEKYEIPSNIPVSHLEPQTRGVLDDNDIILISELNTGSETGYISKHISYKRLIDSIKASLGIEGLERRMDEIEGVDRDDSEVDAKIRSSAPYIISAIQQNRNARISKLDGYFLSTGMNQVFNNQTITSLSVQNMVVQDLECEGLQKINNDIVNFGGEPSRYIYGISETKDGRIKNVLTAYGGGSGGGYGGGSGAGGGVLSGDIIYAQSIAVDTPVNSVSYTVENDCWLAIESDIIEDGQDTHHTIVELKNQNEEDEYNFIAAWNNNGIFQGIQSNHYAYSGVPVLSGSIIRIRTSEPESNLRSGTSFGFYEYRLHGTIQEDRLSAYVTKETATFNDGSAGEGSYVSSVSQTSGVMTVGHGMLPDYEDGYTGAKYVSKVTQRNGKISVDHSDFPTATLENNGFMTTNQVSKLSCISAVSETGDGLMSKEDYKKLSCIEENANNFILTAPTDDKFGGFKLGFQEDEVNKKYPLSVDSNGNGFVQVPWVGSSGQECEISNHLSAKISTDIIIGGVLHDDEQKYSYYATDYLTNNGYTLNQISVENNKKISSVNIPVKVDLDGKMYVNIPYSSNFRSKITYTKDNGTKSVTKYITERPQFGLVNGRSYKSLGMINKRVDWSNPDNNTLYELPDGEENNYWALGGECLSLSGKKGRTWCFIGQNALEPVKITIKFLYDCFASISFLPGYNSQTSDGKYIKVTYNDQEIIDMTSKSIYGTNGTLYTINPNLSPIHIMQPFSSGETLRIDCRIIGQNDYGILRIVSWPLLSY